MTNTKGIVERIKSAKSAKSAKSLLEAAIKYPYISQRTLRRAARKAKARIAELAPAKVKTA